MSLSSMLTSIDTLRVIPEAQHLSKLLKVSKPGQELTPNEFNLFTKFYQSFSKPKIPVQSLLMQANGNIILINEIVGNITAIRQQFAANFQSGEVHPSMATFVAKDELEGWKITSLPREPQTQEEQLNFLKPAGYQIHRCSGVFGHGSQNGGV
jgi:hypothetical protein